jgi:membrane protease YdiL (CAAX protease family)
MGVSVYLAWGGSGVVREESAKSAKPVLSIEEQVVGSQVKVLVGAQFLLDEYLKSSASRNDPAEAEVRSNLRQVFASLTLEHHPLIKAELEAPAREEPPSVTLRQAIAAKHFNFPEETRVLLENFFMRAEPDPAFREILERTLLNNGSLADTAELAFVEQRLGWFGSLLALDSGLSGPDRSEVLQRVSGEAKLSCMKFMVVAVLVSVMAVLSLVLFLGFSLSALLGRVQLQFRPQRVQLSFCLEIFALYLAYMLAMPFAIKALLHSGIAAKPLPLSAAAIALAPLLLVWAKLRGVGLSRLRRTIGLETGGPAKAAADAVAGPLTYVGAICVMFVLLACYSAVLIHFGIDISSGSHPIVPLLLDQPSRATVITTVMLAVVIAPIVEEIMFRGCLYSWMREHLSAPWAIFASALVFSILHPQGAVGVVPLTAIGAMLAFLREWRGTLPAGMLAHACVNGGTLLLLYLLVV